jgi:hypothetical protein
MAFAIGTVFSTYISRQAFYVYGGDGVTGFRCLALSPSANEIPVFAADVAVAFNIFPFDTPAAAPAGFSPTGDLVAVRCIPNDFNTFPSPATGTLDDGTWFRAITWLWGASSALDPAAPYVLLAATDPNRGDCYMFADQRELTLLRKNPLFP